MSAEVKDGRIDDVCSDLKTYADNWEVFVAESGEHKVKREFKQLLRKARKLGLTNLVNHYPDGEPL